MKCSRVNCSRGQMQIQQMAFVLVALMIFFAMAAVFYFSIRMASLREGARDLREGEALELAKAISATPEFSWDLDKCGQCIDLDKVLLLKEKKGYKGFWKMNYIIVEKISPHFQEGECTRNNYPNCTTVTIVNETNIYGASKGAFVSLCRYEGDGGYTKCELGKIYVSAKEVK